MKKIFNSYTLLLICLFGLNQANITAQTTILSGKAVDQETGESLIGVSIKAINSAGERKGAITDFDGNYRIKLEAGIYTITTTYTAYTDQVIENFDAKAGMANKLDFTLGASTAAIAEVVIVAGSMRNTDASLVALQKRSFAIQDGISSQQISRTGVSNAADAMKQVTGAVVEGGKFIVMRGLGDRYSISQLNGITMPSTNPYRNSTNLDLIPAQMIDNIVTMKTFTPDMPGNFSGGLVNINTKSIPDKFNLHFGLSSAFNTQASFNDNFLGHGNDAGRKDWLGIDDGGRALPAILQDEANRALLSETVYLDAQRVGEDYAPLRGFLGEASQALSNTFVPAPKTAPVNHGINFSMGDRLKFLGNTLGYSIGLNYSRKYSHYEDGAVNTWINTDAPELYGFQMLNETKSVETPHLGGLFNLTYKLGDKHTISGTVIYNNDTDIIGRSSAGSYVGQLSDPSATYHINSMEFIQRQFVSYQANGRHIFSSLNDTEVKWSGSLNNSFQNEPDSRFFAYTNSVSGGGEERYDIIKAEFRRPFHFWRELNDKSKEFKLDISIPFLRGNKASSSNQIKIGGLYSQMTRAFNENQFAHWKPGGNFPANLFFNSYQGDFNGFFDYANFGIVDTLYRPDGLIKKYQLGYYYINQVNNKNFYNGDQEIMAAYVMGIYNILPRLKVVLGARLETTDMFVISRDTSLAPATLDLTDLLYAGNLIYSISDKTNIRLAATRTLARPNMRELAPFEQFDPKNGFFNIGNPNLKRTLINNYDLRYEIYPGSGELLAVSLFCKQFNDPILRRFSPTAFPPELGYINIDKATILGAEIEYRKNLGFLGGNLARNLYLAANLALIKSQYKIPQDEINASQQVDSSYNTTTRPFQGQAPYIANIALSYINPENGWESALSFNVSGRKLYNISLAATPDVYQEAIPLLNFKISKRFANHYQISFSAQNLLNPLNKRTMDFRGQNYVAESYNAGTTLGMSVAYSIR